MNFKRVGNWRLMKRYRALLRRETAKKLMGGMMNEELINNYRRAIVERGMNPDEPEKTPGHDQEAGA